MTPDCVIAENRGGFGDYSLPLDKRPVCSAERLRLMDFRLWVCAINDAEYLNPPEQNQFVVFDCVTKQKGWFNMPPGFTPEQVTGLVSDCFASTAYRVSSRVWFV